MKRIIKIASVIMLIAILAISVIGCGKLSENEAKKAIKDLITDAYELNEIYYIYPGCFVRVLIYETLICY